MQCRVPSTVLGLHREKMAVLLNISPKEIYLCGFQGHKGMSHVQAVEAGDDSLISVSSALQVSAGGVLYPQEKNNVV